jgi:hypothetical protein
MKNIKYIFEGVCNFFIYILECVYIKSIQGKQIESCVKNKTQMDRKSKKDCLVMFKSVVVVIF